MSTAVTCKNCNKHFQGHYCPNCGQSSHEGRIDARYILHDIPHSVFHIDKGFFFTLIALFTRPGIMVKEFLEGRRVNYFKPFAYVILMATICTLIVKLISSGLAVEFEKYHPGREMPHPEGFFNHYFSAFIFLMIPFVSLTTWLFFFRHKYNYWEHVIANTYIAAQLNIMQVLIYLTAYLLVLIKKQFINIDFALFVPFFMTAFLYMYGATFGYLMRDAHKTFWLILTITLMNLVLFFIYFTGFQLTGIMRPW